MQLRCKANSGWAQDAYSVARATACVYIAFSIPIRLAFYPDFHVGIDHFPGYVILDVISTVLFSVDTAKLLRGGKRGVVVPLREDDYGSQHSISSGYIIESIGAQGNGCKVRCSWAFIFSLVATLPLEYVDMFINGGHAANLFLINRLLRLMYLPDYLSDISMILERKAVLKNIGLHRAWKLFFAMALAGHWCGCVFFHTARIQALKGSSSTWPQDVGLYRVHETADLDSYHVEMLKSRPEAYIQSLYWAYITMITTGFGDIVPLSIPETVWCIISMYTGVLITTCAIANLQLLVTNMDAALTQFQQKLELTKKYTRYRRLPNTLTNRIISFYEYSWDLLKGADEEKFLGELPGSLQQQVANFMYRDLISSLPVLRKANNALLNALADCAEINIFSPHDDILKPGEPVRGAVLVSRGELVVLKGKAIERKMQQFDRFAEESLFVPKTSDRLIRANTFCEVFLLPARAFQEIINAQCDTAHIARMKETALTLAKNSVKANKMFGSGVDVVPMRGFNKHCHPDSEFRKAWDCVILIGLVYYIIAIPLSVMKSVKSHEFVDSAALLSIGYAIDFMFVVDLILNFNFFMYSQEGLVVFDRERIRKNFIRQHGIFRQVVCVFPIDLLALAPFGARYANIYRLTKLARVPKVVAYVSRTEKLLTELKFGVDQSLGRVIKLNFLMIVVCHWVGCLWYTCADFSDWIGLVDNWKEADELDDSLSIDHSDFDGFTAYLRSVYWAIVGMSTVGYGDIVPTNILETSFALTCVLFGGLVLPAVVGGLAAYMGSFNMAAKDHRKKLAKIRNYMRKAHLEPSLVDKVLRYYDYIFSRQGGVEEEAIVDELPDSLQQRVALHVNGNSIGAVPFFSLCDDSFKQLILSALRPRVFLPGDVITQQGDVGTEMFFIERGKVVVSSEDGKIPFCTLTSGDYFGESCLLGATVRIAVVKALTYCDCFVLSKDDFNSTMSTCGKARRKSITNSVADTVYHKTKRNTNVRRNISERPKCHKTAAPDDITVGNDSSSDTGKFHPDSAFCRNWNVALLTVLMYNAWSIPFRLAFESSISSFAVDWALDVVLFVDMHLNYSGKFSFIHEGELITDAEKVKQHYISGKLRLDLLSTLPLDLMVFLSLIETPRLGLLLALLRVPRLLRLIRLLSLLSDIFRAIEETNLNQAKMQLIEFLSGVILIAHWAACGFFAIARWRNNAEACAGLDRSDVVVAWANQYAECRWTDTWIQRQIINGKVPATGGSTWQLYLRSFNWALPTLVVVVIGDVVPVNSAETLYAFLWMVVGVTINASIIGNVASIVANLDSDLADFVERADQIKSFLHRHQVRYEIHDRVESFLSYIWATHDGMANEDGFVKELPLTLQLAVTETTRKSLIRDCPFFDFCSDDIIKALALCLKPLIFSVGDIFAHEGDMGQEMFFLEKGSVEVLSGDGKTIFATLSDKGCFFGETSLFFKTKRQNTLRAATFCEVFQLDKCDLDEELRQRDFDLSRMLGVFTDIADSNRRRNSAVKANLEASKQPHTKLHKILGTGEKNGAAAKARRAFLPNSSFRAVWDILSMLFTVHFSISIPFRVAFTLDSSLKSGLRWLWLDAFIDIFFIIDMVLRCHHFAFISNGTIITEKGEIGRHYRRHGMILDIMSCLPLEVLGFLLGFEKIFFYRLGHLLRVRRLQDYFKRFEVYLTLWNIRISAASSLLLKMFFFYILVNHWCGCVWFGIHRYLELRTKFTWATTDCAGDYCLAEWNEALGKHNICNVISDCYIRSFYFVITTISTVGYGDIAPVTELETIWQNVVVLIGACFFAGIIGAFTTYLSHNDTSGTNAFKLKISKLQEYMRYRNLPTQLQSEIHTFHQHKWEQSHIMDERAIMSILPLPLKMDLSFEVLKHVIFQVPILRSQTKIVQKRIAHALSLQVCPPHSAVYRVGDIGWDIFFIGKGLCKVELPADLSDLDAAGKADVERLRQKADSVGLVYRIGNHFGESCLTSASGVRQETITARTSAELYSISKDEIEHLWSYMAPEDRDKFRRDLLTKNGNTWHRFDDYSEDEEDCSSHMRPSLPKTSSLRTRQTTFLSWTKSQRFSTTGPLTRRTQRVKRGSSLFDHDAAPRLRSFSAQASKDAMHQQRMIRKVQSSNSMGQQSPQAALSRYHSAAVEIQRLVLSGELHSVYSDCSSHESSSPESSSNRSSCAKSARSSLELGKDSSRYPSRRIWDPGP